MTLAAAPKRTRPVDVARRAPARKTPARVPGGASAPVLVTDVLQLAIARGVYETALESRAGCKLGEPSPLALQPADATRAGRKADDPSAGRGGNASISRSIRWPKWWGGSPERPRTIHVAAAASPRLI